MNYQQVREHKEMLEKIKELDLVIKELNERVKVLETKRRPGRPRKTDANR